MGDFNGDGRADLAMVVGSSPYYVRVWLSTATPRCITCSHAQLYSGTITGTPVGLTLGDWDRDGSADVIVAEQRSSTDYRYQVAFGQRGFSSAATALTFTQILQHTVVPRFVVSGDWNNDGRDDLFAVQQNTTQSWAIYLIYSGGTPSTRAATGGSVWIPFIYVYSVYSFAVGDWSGDSVFAQYDGSSGTRDIGVPVALLIPPPFQTQYSAVATGKVMYGTGMIDTATYSTRLEVWAGVAWSLKAELAICFPVCLLDIEAKIETELRGHVAAQWGTEITKTYEVTYEASGDTWYNPSAGKYEPIVLLVHQAYKDYHLKFWRLLQGSLQSVTLGQVSELLIDVPDPVNTWQESKWLSNYNAGKKPDMPFLGTNRVPGDIQSYRSDSTYTTGSGVWPSTGLLFAEYNGQQGVALTLTQGSKLGWEAGFDISVRGEISVTVAGIGAGFALSAGLGVSWMWNLYHGTSITVGGTPPKLSSLITDDSSPGEEYEIHAYWSRAFLKKASFATQVSSTGLSLLVLDWKAEYLNEGYPGRITSATGSSTSVSVNWLPPGGINPTGGGRLRGVYVQWSTSSTFSTYASSVLLSPGTTSYTVSNLATGTTYYFRIRSDLNSPAGIVTYSNIVSATTNSGGGGGGRCPPTCPT